ncbi:CHRD domain-containing protein [Ornithinimicrobium cerasi]|uniref:CHRD domain-containing protein n=1 Tax=Ornithinimicrobium cerasi TaxID=2248773 RepID=UPI00192A1D7C|nr:CHRD domain-containing protein [Ornithinimicrobium cerasi]
MRTNRLVLAPVVVLVSLGLVGPAQATDTYTARLSSANEVPERETRARGTTVLKLSGDRTELDYRLIVANIDNVVAAHIHLGEAGTNGPVVAFLAGPLPLGGGATNGVLATGTITEDDLIGPLAGMSMEDLITAFEAGDAYVNVHTNDGTGETNTGPGDFPGGEVRGQIR